MIRTHQVKRQRGFSLAEILVAVAVFAIIFIAALMIYDRSNRVFKSGVESSTSQQSTRVAFDRVVADLRMAGFDYDRDGIPTGSVGGVNQSQQPDEQIEYIGQGAVSFRGNFDYETDATNQNGREIAYEPAGKQFPVVTTGNDEIISYVLMSPTAPAGNPVTFYVDSFKPRKVYPIPSGVPEKEKLITIASVTTAAGQTLYPDQTNQFPPYTLYRVTLEDCTAPCDGSGLVFTPVAENIRSMNLQFYEDSAGTVPLRTLGSPTTAPVVITQANLSTTVGGQGQFDPANPAASLTQRAIRGKIQSVRVTLIGMNEAADYNYTDPTETIATARPFRKYRLESLVTPRNYARRGMREQEFNEPGAPILTRVCYGYCGMFYLEWTAPAPAAGTGSVESYGVLFDTDTAGGFANIIDVGNVTSAFISVPNPSMEWYFAVEAINSYGAAVSNTIPASGAGISANNATKPLLDGATLKASGSDPGNLPVLGNQILLQWQSPQANAAGAPTCTSGVPPVVYPDDETRGYEVWRKVDDPADPNDQNFTPGDPLIAKQVLTGTASGVNKPIMDPLTKLVTWTDFTAANCIKYWYKVRAVERCPGDPENVNLADDGYSDWTPAVNGEAVASYTPDPPPNLNINDAPQSNCDTVLPDGTTVCTVSLSWPVVGKDTTGANVTIDRYEIERIQKLNGVAQAGPFTATISVTSASYTESGGVITYVDNAGLPMEDVNGVQYIYEYRVRAVNCGTPGGYSPMRFYPCAFSTGVSVTLSNTLEGAGTLANPWMITAPSTLTLTTTQPVQYMRARLYTDPSNSILLCEANGPVSTLSCGWPTGLADEQVYRLSVFLQEASVSACTSIKSFFAMESNNNCCLTPQSFDATVVALDPPSGIVTIKLDNNCDENVTIQPDGVRIKWNAALLSSAGPGQKRLERFFYPNNGGQIVAEHNTPNNQNTTSPITSDPGQVTSGGPGDSVVEGNTSNYKFIIDFNKNFTTNPVTGVCITYLRPSSLAAEVCQVVPQPSANANVCD